jgi:negative regulator of flagellin synthesis FlgM
VPDGTGPGNERPTPAQPARALRERKSQANAVDGAKKLSKVEAIKAAFAKGLFSVDDEVVADTLIGHTKKALRKRSRIN